MKYFLTVIFLSIFIFGCKKETAQTAKVVEVVKPKMSIVINHKKPTLLEATVKEQLKDWNEYSEFVSFLSRFENISPNQALSSANELKTLVKDLKENVDLEILKSDAFNARIDVLENEILRLFDMTLIPSITVRDVNFQVDKIFLLFSSLNAKINTVFMQERYNKGIDLNYFFTLDSTEKKGSFNKIDRADFKKNSKLTLPKNDFRKLENIKD